MMFGTEELFEYLLCGKCESLHIINIPQDIAKYYPNESYYSFSVDSTIISKFKKTIKMKIFKKRDEYSLFKMSLFGKLINKKFPNTFLNLLGDLNINYDSKILDVGCGSGKFLFQLENLNFKQLLGIDPFLDEDLSHKNLFLEKKDIFNLQNKKFDFIIFNHSFEHLDNPIETLKKVNDLLKKNGTCIIRMPVKSKSIWRRYGINWVQIDAPRHFFIYTLKGLKIILNQTDLQLIDSIFDSTEFQFWGSEQYKKGISLLSEKSYLNNKNQFTKNDINEFKKDALKLNMEKEGDQATFIIRKVDV